jgi:hypothetical protein
MVHTKLAAVNGASSLFDAAMISPDVCAINIRARWLTPDALTANTSSIHTIAHCYDDGIMINEVNMYQEAVVEHQRQKRL